jgi:hypothetical protein
MNSKTKNAKKFDKYDFIKRSLYFSVFHKLLVFRLSLCSHWLARAPNWLLFTALCAGLNLRNINEGQYMNMCCHLLTGETELIA